MDPITMFETAATNAAALARTVPDDGCKVPTPCTEWDVAALLEHMGGGVGYLLGALGLDPSAGASWPDQSAVAACVSALSEPGALKRTCMSPAGFEWTVGEAAAGTAMDQLIHTWDLAVALDVERSIDPQIAEAIVEMFVPQMPEVGRQAGFVGPAVPVDDGASARDRLLGAMGRDPAR